MVECEMARQSAQQRHGITRPRIGRFIRAFYAEVRLHSRLGPMFEGALNGRWEEHFETLTDFWCSIVLKDGSYRGHPLAAHKRLPPGIVSGDFVVWLALFESVVRKHFAPEAVALFLQPARRIADNLERGMFPSPSAGDEKRQQQG